MPFTTQTSEFYGWYLRHNTRVIWKHLADAGIDLFAVGPSNNTQSFLDLTNVLPAMNEGFSPRWPLALAAQSTVTVPGTPPLSNQIRRNFVYNFPQDSSDTADTTNTNIVFATDGQYWHGFTDSWATFTGYGPTDFTTNTGDPFGVASRGYFYYGNGVDAPRKVNPSYITSSTDTLNGIAVPYNNVLNPGLTSFTGYPNVVGISGGCGEGYLTAPSVTVFDVPGGSGSGATVTINSLDGQGGIGGFTITGGSNYTCAYCTVDPPPSGGTQAYLCLYTQTNSNGPNFGEVMGGDYAGPMSFLAGRRYGVALQNSKTGHTSDVAMSVINGNTLSSWAPGPTSGATFNSLTAAYSTPQPFTGTDTYPIYTASVNASGQAISAGFTQLYLQVWIPDDLDPQVDTVLLLATSDGGSIGTLFEVASLPLSSFLHFPLLGIYALGTQQSSPPLLIAPYSDALPDSYNNATGIFGVQDTLLASNVWAETDSAGDINGILLNTPPTALGFKYPVQHQGRMFATDGQAVYYSKSIDEVTTSTDLITAKWEECWPGDYVLPIALNNEEIIGLISDGTNLHVGTDKSIFTIYGSDPSNFSVPSQAFAQTGILSNDLWTVIYAEGIPSGFVWITQDYKIVHSDFSTYREIGMGIYPLFPYSSTGGLNPTLLEYSKVFSLTQGPYNFVVFQLFFRSIAQPVFLLWETRLQKWYRWTVDNTVNSGVTGAGFVYQYPAYTSSTGIPGSKFLFFHNIYGSGSNNYKLFYFDPGAALQGWDLGTSYIPWNVQTSWQDLGDATAIKCINEIELTSDSVPQSVTLWGATSQTQFDTGGVQLKTGPSVMGPMSALATNKFYTAGVPTGSKYFSIQFSGINPGGTPASLPNVLTSFSLEFYPMARI